MKRKTVRAEEFTEPRVAAYTCPESRLVTRGPNKGKLVPVDYALFWDERVIGLGVRVMRTGARSYIFEKRVHGASQRVTIDCVSLGDARKKAKKLTGADDPKAEKAAKRAEADAKRLESQRHTHVVAAVWQAYIAANDAKLPGKRWGERHRQDHIDLARPGGVKKKRGTGLTKAAPLAALMPLKLSDLTSDTVAAWLKREVKKKRPTSAAGAYRLLRAFCAWTQEKHGKDIPDYRRIVALDACTASEVLEWLPVSDPKKDKLQGGDLSAWFKAVRKLSNPVIAAFLQCLVLTGARREELGRLKWTDIDEKEDPRWSTLTLRDKVSGTRDISLTPYVASLLKSLPRRNKWVFSSETAKGGRLVEPTKAHKGVLKAADIKHVSLHGLRRSFATLPDSLDDMPAGVIAQIMGHKPSATAEKHYKTRSIDVLHKWHAKLETWILEQAGVPFARPGEKAKPGSTVGDNGTVQTTA